LPGGGAFYFHLRDEISNWSSLNLIGDEFFASQIILDAFKRPLAQLLENTNNSIYKISENLLKMGYPSGYNLIEKKYCNTFENGLLDSAKSIRAILWNSITIVSILITSD
jgi:chaperonin GroEL (HSP60 family)